MRKLLGLSIIAVLSLASGQAASSDHQKNKNSEVFTPGPPDEAQLAKEVRHGLLMLPYYSIFDALSFQLNGSVVTLVGACPGDPPWDIKSDAGNVVKRLPGVTGVVNNIKVLPLSPFDWQIRRAEARAIYGSPDIGDRYGYQSLPSIHIIVDNGHVTLMGVVDNEFDNTLIRTRANTVPNVFSVTDDLIVLHNNKKEK